MTERGLPIVDGAPACPFVAFEDDRDERASSPDHRHRCYAEPNPAPRALAHQEAYCLSSAFPVCPTFQDWARREAARSRGESPTSRDADGALASEPVQRNPPRDWAAPPPWMSGAAPDDEDVDDRWERDDEDEAVAPAAPARKAAPAAGDGEDEDDDAEDAVPAEAARGLSGSFADRLASGAPLEPAAVAPDEPAARYPEDEPRAPAPPAAPQASGQVRPRRDRELDRGTYGAPAMAEPARPASRPSRPERRDPRAPEWERARPMEAYPTLRARRLPELSVPPILVSVIALALAAAVLFALPGLLGFGQPGAGASPTAAARPSPTPEVSVAPTPEPEPTPRIYIVQQGDTMSRIANRFDVPLDELIAANEENIPNPDKLQIGDQVIIPVVEPEDVESE